MRHRRATEEAPAQPAPDDAHGHARAFERIVREHEQRVRRVLRCRGVAERDLADAQQEVFLIVHRKLAQFEGRSTLGTWLHRIALNVASEHHRRARNRYERLQQSPGAEPSTGDPERPIHARDALARVNLALESLGDAQRDVFLLHEIAGLSMQEVASQLGIPLKTAFSRFYAARRALGAALGRRGIAMPALLSWLASSWQPRGFMRRARAQVVDAPALSATAAPAHLAVLVLAIGALSSLIDAEVAPAVLADGSAAARPLQRWVRSATAVPHAAVPQTNVPVRTPADNGPAARAAGERALLPTRRGLPASQPRAHAVPPADTLEDGGAVFAGDAYSPAGTYDFTVTRSGARDVRPRLAHPLSERVEAPPAPPRIHVQGLRDPACRIEEQMGGACADRD